jgi:hypothetical protein
LDAIERDAGAALDGPEESRAQPLEVGDRAQEEDRRPLGAAGTDQIADVDDDALPEKPETAVVEDDDPHGR